MPDPRFVGHLHTATAVFHAVADADLITACRTITGYREYLEKSYDFELGVERAFADTPGLEATIDLDARSRVAALTADLEGMGLQRAEIEALPVGGDRTSFDGVVGGLGWVFVLDRPPVAPRHAARALAPHRPMMATALAYFTRLASR